MAKRKPERDAEAPPGAGPAVETAEAETQIELKMKGTASDITKRLTPTLAVGAEVARPERPALVEEPESSEEKELFLKSLRNAKFIFKVKRTTPREFDGVKTNVEVWSDNLPLSFSEIIDEVSKEHGGGKYRVSIVDPDKQVTIAAENFTIDGPPFVAEVSDLAQLERDKIFLQGADKKNASELHEEGLERAARVTAKQIELQTLQRQLAEIKGGGERKGDDPVVRDLERRLIEAQHKADLEAREAAHRREMAELKAAISQVARPSGNNDQLTILLQQMAEDRKASDARFTAMMNQMKDEKMNLMLEELRAMRNKPQTQSSSLLDQAEAILKLKKVFGWGGDEDDDDDDVDPANDTRPWWEKALDKLGDKIIPKLVAKFDGLEGEGKTVDRETFMKEVQIAAKQAEDEAVARAQERINAPPPRQTLPAPPSAPKLSLVPPAPVTAPVTELPPPPGELPPPPPAAAAPPPAPAAPPAAQAAQMTVEQEIAMRVVGVLSLIEREMFLRPNDYSWTDGAWNGLSEDSLEKLCAAPDAPSIVDALTVEGMIPEKLAELKAKITGSPKILAWLTRGLTELKEWWAAKQADPSFDPFAEDEEEQE